MMRMKLLRTLYMFLTKGLAVHGASGADAPRAQ